MQLHDDGDDRRVELTGHPGEDGGGVPATLQVNARGKRWHHGTLPFLTLCNDRHGPAKTNIHQLVQRSAACMQCTGPPDLQVSFG